MLGNFNHPPNPPVYWRKQGGSRRRPNLKTDQRNFLKNFQQKNILRTVWGASLKLPPRGGMYLRLRCLPIARKVCYSSTSTSQSHSSRKLRGRSDMNHGDIIYVPSTRFVSGNEQSCHPLCVVERLTVASREGNKHLLMPESG